ncbi:MAG: SOS response-associated peptidase family protein [Ramlibacter sp.]|nr:SOS response-associated peptidase family protein [Ramlibacter sp.]
MCSNFLGVTDPQRLLQYFNASSDGRAGPPEDTYPGQFSPMLIRATGSDPTAPPLKAVDAIFRFVPDFVSKLEWARNTFNARGEEVQSKRTYKGAWAAGRRCIIPTELIYEPNYESGKYERWSIHQPGYVPMGIAGIYNKVRHENGTEYFAMCMLTVNADDHPFMRRFHKPEDEKRMVVILAPEDYQRWLDGSVAEAATMLRQWHGPLVGEHAPAPPRKKAPKAVSGKVVQPKPEQGGLF